MLNREELMKFIPKPKNEDVIIYNTELSDLIDIDVFQEYEKDIKPFLQKRDDFNVIKLKIKEMENFINNVYLYKPSWSREDYLIKLKNDKRTYSTMYKDIKKDEDNLLILEKKLKTMNDKIAIQEAKENKKLQDKKQNLDDEIQKDKNNLENLKEKMSFYTLQQDIINQEISKNEIEFNDLCEMQEDLKTGQYQCKFCGCHVNVYSENSRIYKRLEKNLENNKINLEKLLKKKESVDKEIAYYKTEISKVKINLNNNINFKKDNHFFYQKKTIEILKLEALRDDVMNNIAEIEKKLKTKPQLKSEQYIELKNNIEKYELSLQNLDKIKEIKENMKEDINNYKFLKEELTKTYNKLIKYKEFITLYYKICEQKINEYFGPEYKFKLFKFDDLVFKPIFELKYNDVEYSQLSKEDKEIVDKSFNEKISIFY